MNGIHERTPLAGPALGLIIGIIISAAISVPVVWLFILLAILLIITFFLSRHPLIQGFLIGIGCVLSGAVLYSLQQQNMQRQWTERPADHEAVIASEPVARGKTLSMDALLASSGDKIQMRIMRDEQSAQLQVGDGIVFHAAVKPLSAQGSYLTYLQSHGYVGETFVWHDRWHGAVVSMQQLSIAQRSRLFFLSQRHQLLQHLRTTDISDEAYAIVAAMALGDKTAVTREQRDVFTNTGTSHLLALSGLHLGIIYLLLSQLFPRRRARMVSRLLIVSSIWAFVLLVGMPSSVVRAAVMITVYAIIDLIRRGHTSLNTLALTAIIMLIMNPSALFDVGFQLSFSSVLAILLFTPLLTKMFTMAPETTAVENSKPGNAVTNSKLYTLSSKLIISPIISTTAVSLAAQFGTAPLVAYHFGQFSPYFLLANYVAIPLTVLTLYCTLALLLTFFWPAFQSVIAIALTTLVSWLSGWLGWLSSLPCSTIEGLHPTILQAVAAYVLIGCLYALLRLLRNNKPQAAK